MRVSVDRRVASIMKSWSGAGVKRSGGCAQSAWHRAVCLFQGESYEILSLVAEATLRFSHATVTRIQIHPWTNSVILLQHDSIT